MFLITFILIQLTSCEQKKPIYKEGVYEGIGEGHAGIIKIELVTDKYNIKDIKIVEDSEIPIIAEIVYKKIPKQVIKKNSGEVGVVTGATLTSKGLIQAINDALKKAKIDNSK